jgi:hypothetical protein
VGEGLRLLISFFHFFLSWLEDSYFIICLADPSCVGFANLAGHRSSEPNQIVLEKLRWTHYMYAANCFLQTGLLTNVLTR